MRVLIVEDELPARNRLKKMLIEISSEIEVIAGLDSVSSVIAWLKDKNLPDAIFLDIHLADGNAFEIFKHVKITCPVIFTTAYDKYAIQAFRSNATDYLLKPIKRAELQDALQRISIKKEIDLPSFEKLVKLMESKEEDRRFLVKLGARFFLTSSKDIAYFYTAHKQAFIVKKDGKRLPIDKALDQIETELDPHKFFRINRQMIVSINSIKELFPASKARVRLKLEPEFDGEVVVSAERSPTFKQWLQNT